MVIICLFIFLSYIRPEVDNLTRVNKEKAEAQEKINSIKEKTEAAKLLSQKIRETKAYKEVIYNYLPDRKVEEQIIAGINYLASDAQVFLADISMKDAAPKKKEAVLDVSTSDPMSAEAGEDQNKEMLFSEATIKIIGEYEKMQLFFDQLQKMALFNNIKSLKIYKEEVTNNTNNPGEATGNNQATSLLAEIVIDFGYLEKAKINENNLAEFKATLDESIVTTLTGYRSQKIVSGLPSDQGMAEGKSNPFLP